MESLLASKTYSILFRLCRHRLTSKYQQPKRKMMWKTAIGVFRCALAGALVRIDSSLKRNRCPANWVTSHVTLGEYPELKIMSFLSPNGLSGQKCVHGLGNVNVWSRTLNLFGLGSRVVNKIGTEHVATRHLAKNLVELVEWYPWS